MPKVLLDFQKYLISTKNYSPITAKEYCDDLIIFFKYIKQYFKLDINIKDITVFILADITEDIIFSFLVYLNYHKDNCAITRQRKLSSIKTFYKWLLSLKYPSFKNKKNPAENIPSITRIERLPKYINFEKAKELQNIFNNSNCKYPERNNAITTLFLQTGIRISSLLKLNISDIDFDNKNVKIIAKGNKENTIYLNDFTIAKIEEYLKTRSLDNDALFVSERNKRISKATVEHICKQAFKLSGMANKGYSPHTLRHTAATLYFKNTKDILVVKEILGHKSLSSTEIYLHIDNQEIKKAVEANPLNDYLLNFKKK